MILYLVNDGIKEVGYKTINSKQFFGSNYHLITYDFKTNEGYIDKKGENYWRLYTQVGQKIGQSRYYKFSDFEKCVERLKELKGDNEIIIFKANEFL